jgi:predicted amidohydrolase
VRRAGADVAVTGDRITEIGDGLDGKRTLDAAGHVVAPGFIDIPPITARRCSGTRRSRRPRGTA